MIIDDKVLTKLEKLSAFTIPEEKRENFKKELAEFVNFAEILNEIDLQNLEAQVSTVNGGTPFRQDIVKENQEIREIILKNAPNSEQNYFVVPKIIE